MPDPTSEIRAIRSVMNGQTGRIRMRMIWALLVAAGLALIVPVALLALLDTAAVLREPSAMWALVGCVVIAAAALVAGAVTVARRLPDGRRVALMLETARPEFMDSLICAIEIAERPPESWTQLDRALLAKVEQDLSTTSVQGLLSPPPRVLALWSAGGVLCLLGLILLPGTPLVRKATAHAMERFTGKSTGLIVTPGAIELGAGDDLLVTARIMRGEDSASITVIGPDGRIRHDMYGRDAAEHAFPFYDIQAPFEYYISTPTLRSPTYRVSVFSKPSIQNVAIHVAPPAYTRQPAQHYTEWRNIIAPVGSVITIEAATNMPVDLTLQPSDGTAAIPFAATDGKQNRAEFTLTRSFAYRYAFDDRQGHLLTGDREYRIEALPDYPPNIQIVTPDDNAVHELRDTVAFDIIGSDDYGLVSMDLVYVINGGTEMRRLLYRDDAGELGQVTEQQVQEALALQGEVQYGDVITWWVEATDGAVPEPNVAASELRFIEIRPTPENMPQDGQGQQGEPGEAGELSVSDLIEDQKQLIRNTFNLRRLKDDDERAVETQAVAKSASDLLLAATQRFNDLKRQTGAENFGLAGSYFEAAIAHMEKVESLLSQGSAVESLPSQRQALANLIALEIELLKNTMQQQAQQQQQSSQQQQQSQQDQQQQQDMSEMAQEKLAAIKEAMEQLDTVIQRQENLGDALADRLGADATAKLDDLARRQEQINQDAKAIRDTLNDMPEARSVEREIARALERMQSAATNMQRQQGGSATKDEEMAEEFLHRGRDLLGQLQSDMSGSKLEAADRLLDAIKDGQAQLRELTEAAEAGGENMPSKADMAKAQQALRESLAELAERLADARDALEGDNPTAANELTEAMQALEDANVDGKMKRAENALRYGQFGKAAPYQAEAEQGMEQLGEAIKEAIRQDNSPSTEQLAQMLQETLRNMAELKKALESATSEEERQALREKIAESMERMAGRTGDPTLESLAGEADAHRSGKTGSSGDQALVRVLEEAAGVLENRLLESLAAEKLRLSRLSGREAPDEYRKLVDEYFKNLSDTADR